MCQNNPRYHYNSSYIYVFISYMFCIVLLLWVGSVFIPSWLPQTAGLVRVSKEHQQDAQLPGPWNDTGWCHCDFINTLGSWGVLRM